MSETLVLPSDAAYREQALPLVERRLARVAHRGGPAMRRYVDALIEHRMPLGLTTPVVRTACSTCGVTTRVPVLDLGWLTYCDVCGHRLLAGDTPWSEIVGPRPPNQAWGMFDHRTGRLRRHSLGLRAELVVGRHRIALPGGELGTRHLLASGAARPSRLLVHNAGRRPLAAGLLATSAAFVGARDPLPLVEPGEATILPLEREQAEIRLYVGAEHTLEERAIPVISVDLGPDLDVDVQFRGLTLEGEEPSSEEPSGEAPVSDADGSQGWTVTGEAAGVALRFAPIAPTIEGATATLTIGEQTRRLLAHVRRRLDAPPDHEWLAVDAFADAPPGAPFRVDVRYRTLLAVVTASGRLAGGDEPAVEMPSEGPTAERADRAGPDPLADVAARGPSLDAARSPDSARGVRSTGDPARPPAGIASPRPLARASGRPWNVPLVLSVHAGAVAARRLDESRPLLTGLRLADDAFAIEPDGRIRVGLAAVDWALDDWKRRPLGVDWWQALTSSDGRALDPGRPARTAVGRPSTDRGPLTTGQALARALDSHLRAITSMRSGHPDQIALVLPPRATEVHLESMQRLLAAAAPGAELFLELDTSAALVLDALRGPLSSGSSRGRRRVVCVMLEPHQTTVTEHRVRWQTAGPGGRRLEVHLERGLTRGLNQGLDRAYGALEGMLHQAWSRARDGAARRAREDRISDERLWLFDASRRQLHTNQLRDRRLALMRGAAPTAVGAAGLSETTRLPVEQTQRVAPGVELPPAERLLLGCLARFALSALAAAETVRIGEAPEQRRLLRHLGSAHGSALSAGSVSTVERGAVVDALRPAVAELVEGLRPMLASTDDAPRGPTATPPPRSPLAQTRSMQTTLSGLPRLPADPAGGDEPLVVVHAPAVVVSALSAEWARAGLDASWLHPAPFEQRPELRGAVDYYAATRFGLGAFDPIIDPVGQRVLVAVSPAGHAREPLIPCGCSLGTAWTWLPVQRPACMLHFISWAGEVVAHAVRSLDGLSFIGDATFAQLQRDPQMALRVWVESRFDEHRRAVMGEIVRLEGGTWAEGRDHVEHLRQLGAAVPIRSGTVLRPAPLLPDGMRETPLTVAPFEFHEYPGFLLGGAGEPGP